MKRHPPAKPAVIQTTQHAVILCPGPSLAAVAEVPRADLVIGVNRAATRFRCTHWAALDWPLVEQEIANVVGQPCLITKGENHHRLRGRDISCFAVENFREKVPETLGWTNFSATAALAWCLTLTRVKDVTVYGADWAVGAPDFDGVMASANRTADRFAWEAGVWARLCVYARERGVVVERVGGNDVPR